MTCSFNRVVSFAFVIISFVFASAAMAGGLNPTAGNPPTATRNGVLVSLIPDPASFRPYGSCSWLMPAARTALQTYNNATNIWNFTPATQQLDGSFTLQTYAAWAVDAPQVSLTNTYATPNPTTHTNVARSIPNHGGAAFVITYNPMGTDPTPNNLPAGTTLHWIQVVDTNTPGTAGARGVAGTGANGIPTGTTAYLDNSNGADPYYGRISRPPFATANGSGFLDRVSKPLVAGTLWEAQTFLTTEMDTMAVVNGKTVTTHNVTIYDGVWWGFQMTAVPEPSTWVMLVIGCGVVGFVRGRALLGRMRATA